MTTGIKTEVVSIKNNDVSLADATTRVMLKVQFIQSGEVVTFWFVSWICPIRSARTPTRPGQTSPRNLREDGHQLSRRKKLRRG